MTTEVRHPYQSPRHRVSISGFEKTRTKQQFTKECDINLIMTKFQKNGILTHLNKYGPQYGEVSGIDLLDAMTTLTKAQDMYDDLPSNVRKQFESPAEFLDFVGKDENIEKLREWGLANPLKDEEPVLVRVHPTSDQDPAPEPE